MLVIDIADDLFDHVLDREQAGYAAVLVDDDGHVVAIGAELLEQDVQPLAFRNEDGRPQHSRISKR